MALTPKNICRDRRLARKARQLYRTAFPREERIPWWVLWLNAHRKDIDLTAWMNGEVFCGFTASVTVERFHFLLFFAVDPELRDQGWGSQILSLLRETYETVALNVELLDPRTENYAQRKRRFAFYQKNGFYDTGYHVWEVGGKFRVLGTEPALNVPAYKKIFRKLTLGIWDVRLQEAQR